MTPRELQVAMLAATGLSNLEIAQRLAMSPLTVKLHLHNIYKKLKIRNRTTLGWFLSQQSAQGGEKR